MFPNKSLKSISSEVCRGKRSPTSSLLERNLCSLLVCCKLSYHVRLFKYFLGFYFSTVGLNPDLAEI
jgi:hypothetical protein